MRRTRLLFAAWAMTAAAAPAAAQQNERPSYTAGWQVPAQPEQKNLRVAESRFAPILAAAALMPGNALPKDPAFSVSWVILPQSLPSKQVTLRPNASETLFRIAPKTVYRLPVAAVGAKGKVLVAARTFLAAVDGEAGMVCEPVRHSGAENFNCLIDSDHDGRFDSFRKLPTKIFTFSGRGMNMTKLEYLFSAATPLSAAPLGQPIAVDTLEPGTDFPPLAVELLFAGHGGLGSASMFQLCIIRADLKDVWGGELPERVCMPQQVVIKDSALPTEQNFMGTRVRFLSVAGKEVQAEIDYRSAGGEFR